MLEMIKLVVGRLGYPCMRISNNVQTVRTCQLKNAEPDYLRELIDHNLRRLRDVLEYNRDQSIDFFRIHSDTIPFASHPDVDFDWLSYAGDQLKSIGEFIRSSDVRITMHPGHYTVLNSPKDHVRENTRRNLKYHAQFLDGLGLGTDAKIILHVGGVYGNRQIASDRFVEQAQALDESIQNRLVVENDEDSYNVKHVLNIAEKTDLPVVFDWLHHQLYAPDTARTVRECLEEVFNTWNEPDGQPIVHFSSSRTEGNGHHADRIEVSDFIRFATETVELPSFDVMLECKDKEKALLNVRSEFGRAFATD